ncbi:MAG: chromosome segregation ATPase [Nostocaceae cyanobacterium]|nr:chromosome segregation ATPase [Nostocaceae cyanobacterium]
MTERGIPESWSVSASQPEQANRLSRTPPLEDSMASVKSPVVSSGTGQVRRQVSKVGIKGNNKLPDQARATQEDKPTDNYSQWQRWLKNWMLWAVVGAVFSGGVGFTAITMLLKLPAAPNCPAIFWPLASASMRLHCAQIAASKQTVNDLLQAIALVRGLPKDHPLRMQIDQLVEEWSEQILGLADESFQQGKLKEAIAMARKIPQEVAAYKLVEEQISKWESTWRSAEEIYQEAESQMRQQRWHLAFMAASKLLNVGNNYWATTKYDELSVLITQAREDANKLAKAKSLGKTGILNNLLEAIRLARSVASTSYVYQDAKEAIPEFGRNILALAEGQLGRRNIDTALEIVRKIPNIPQIEAEKQDFILFVEARRSAWTGSVVDLETAISQAQRITPNSRFYTQAQELASRWQLEIEDLTRLAKARDIAQQGTVADLRAAIEEARQIPSSNPRANEARREMTRWRQQVETIEDQPFLNRADELAMLGDLNSLQAAIKEASRVTRGRALHQEAQKRIGDWASQIERIQDQPILERARELASSGDLTSAIATAEPISRGRVLSREAKASLDDWKGQIRSRENWQQARQIALEGTPEALSEAIRQANRVPTSSPLRSDVDPAIEQWSQQLLSIALTRGESDVQGGIEIAKMIPEGTDAYSSAQEQIRQWKEFLNSEPQPEPEDTSESQESSGTQ